MRDHPKPLFIKVFFEVAWLVIAVSGCTSLPEVGLPEDTRFTVQGRLGVRDGKESYSSSFSWAQGVDSYRIELWGPLGQGRTRLVGDGERVTVYAANGDVVEEPDSATAMRRWLGFSVPIDALTRWIQGHPAPEFAAEGIVRDAHGDLEALDQLGWTLAFSGYRDVEPGRRVPGKIIANRSGIRVTLVPKEWTFSSTFQ